MARNYLLRPFLLSRDFLGDKLFVFSNHSFNQFSIKTLTTPTISPPNSRPPFAPLSPSHSKLFTAIFFSFPSRCFCSSSEGSSNIVVIKTEEEFSSSLKKAQDDCLPAIFYFTAAWCGPCKLISPVIEESSKKYPHVTTYKIDVDQKGLENTLSNLSIYSVPTLHFFHNGKKVAEVVGADIMLLRRTMESLYK